MDVPACPARCRFPMGKVLGVTDDVAGLEAPPRVAMGAAAVTLLGRLGVCSPPWNTGKFVGRAELAGARDANARF